LETQKAERFARFLARRYYRDRLTRSFRSSRMFAGRTGRRAEEICDTLAFAPFLDDCVLGSLVSAQRVAAVATAYLAEGRGLFPWWDDLLAYESAHLLQTATTERAQPGAGYRRSPSAVCRRLGWALPEMLSRLRRGEEPGEGFRRAVTLLFSRTHMGRIFVVELDAATAALFDAADGSRTLPQIAEAAGVAPQAAAEALRSLCEVGAVEAPA
jgi:hypothetical protein